jgi:hypothetical protein
VQLECPISEAPHPFATVKSPLAITAEIPVSVRSPAFVSVTGSAPLVVPICCAAKLNINGASESVATVTPVPLSEAVCVPTESVMLRLPVHTPRAVGAKSIATVHPVLAASVVPHVFAEMAKFPVTTGVPRVAATPPVFEIVTFWGALTAPTVVWPKLTGDGVS